MEPLKLEDYAEAIHLHEPFIHNSLILSENEKLEVVAGLLTDLMHIVTEFGYTNPETYEEKRKLLHATIDVLEPSYLNDEQIAKLNSLLKTELFEKGIVKGHEIAQMANHKIHDTKIVVWQGDITTLQTDAIVNAANNRLLGCFQPLHACIDNAIHTAAGVQLRNDCYTIMQKQKMPEPTGEVKITRAYNLPSQYVLHTVGPIVQGELTEKHKNDLAKSYLSCLNICKSMESITSIAFCCISTGVFGYPPEHAARQAFKTVCDWLEKNPGKLDYVIFNVFSGHDKMIYESLFESLWKVK